jgi:hypothetical protein
MVVVAVEHDGHPARGKPPHPASADDGLDLMSLMYEIRIKGRVGDHLADALGLTTVVEPADTVLRGPVKDQDDLHGILARLQDMGLELVEIRQLPEV